MSSGEALCLAQLASIHAVVLCIIVNVLSCFGLVTEWLCAGCVLCAWH